MAKLPKHVREELDANIHLGRWASVVKRLPAAQRSAALRYVVDQRLATPTERKGLRKLLRRSA